ncbi:hypothetical protein [Streptomyces sp. 2A115]|uniref:hypothetical protein n=1 Tax=Streptomyces sp. 2A115 TaxID=3457439 RepID=UPI003FD6A127
MQSTAGNARSRADAAPGRVGAWQVIRGAIDQAFSQKKWDDFLSMHAWFENNKTFFRDQVERFRSTERLAVATYGVTQDDAMTSDFTEKSTPWLLNSLFCPYTVQPGKDGPPRRNRTWINQSVRCRTPD